MVSFVGLQIEYSLIERSVERELVQMSKALNLGLTARSPLARGILTGKYHGHGSSEQGHARRAAMGLKFHAGAPFQRPATRSTTITQILCDSGDAVGDAGLNNRLATHWRSKVKIDLTGQFFHARQFLPRRVID